MLARAPNVLAKVRQEIERTDLDKSSVIISAHRKLPAPARGRPNELRIAKL